MNNEMRPENIRIRFAITFSLMFTLIMASSMLFGGLRMELQAQIGDLSFFGGVSEGRRLPKTTEQLLAQGTAQRNQTTIFRYSELVFLQGEPQLFEGFLEVRTTGNVDPRRNLGTFNVTHRVFPNPNTANGDVVIDRQVTFRVNWRRLENGQIIYDYVAQTNNWRCNITVDGELFILDPRQSFYSVGIIEDPTPGVRYYRGNISGQLVYVQPGNGGNTTAATVSYFGEFHGYDNHWSATQTFRLDVDVDRGAGSWALSYQIRPSVSARKEMQFNTNEPQAMSFRGNFMEVQTLTAGLVYNFISMPRFLWQHPVSGGISIQSPNTFEQLPAFDTSFLRGNAAEDDIARLFSLQVLRGEPRHFQPGQAISRGQFVTMVTRAIRMPIEPVTNRNTVALRRNPPFSDVTIERPEFPYIRAAAESGLATGRANGKFYFDYAIERQEAVVIIIRALGLSQMGLNPAPVTPFVDDAQVSGWARGYLNIANHLGLISADVNGNIHPRQLMTNGEAANFINHMIEYMRNGLASDFADQIVNIAR